MVGTALSDWNNVLHFVATQTVSYFRDGDAAELPTHAAGLFENTDQTSLLRIRLGSVDANCHFFREEDIELDIDPKKIASQTDLENLLSFISG